MYTNLAHVTRPFKLQPQLTPCIPKPKLEFVAVRVWLELEKQGEGLGEALRGGVVGGSSGNICCDFLSRGKAMADGAAEFKGDLVPTGGKASCDPCFPVVDRDLASDFA
jgi:hypothetical protein